MNSLPAQQLAPITSADQIIVNTWLYGKSKNTIVAYRREADDFLAFVGKPLAQCGLVDLQAWIHLKHNRAAATQARSAAAIKSLLGFAHRMGAVPVNFGAGLQVAKPTSVNVERILTLGEVRRLIAAGGDDRRRGLLQALYTLGLRASEMADLRWKHMAGSAKKGGQAQVLGKGSKLRAVEVPAELWRQLEALAPMLTPEAPVCPGRAGRPLDRKVVFRIVKAAGRRAGLGPEVSPHWIRHAHATHALEAGCPLHVLQKSLGHSNIATTSRYLHVKAGEGSAAFVR